MSSADVVSPDEWTNEPLDVRHLPQLDTSPFTALDPAYRRLRTATAAATSATAVIVMVATGIAAERFVVWLIGAALVLLAAAASVIHRLEVDRMGYLVREHDLSFRSGLIGRSVATAPFARVQHVSIARGPIDRRFGLATLTVHTAGGSLTVPGLTVERAERLKAEITDRAVNLAAAEIEPDVDRDVEPTATPVSDASASWPAPGSAADRGDAADE